MPWRARLLELRLYLRLFRGVMTGCVKRVVRLTGWGVYNSVSIAIAKRRVARPVATMMRKESGFW